MTFRMEHTNLNVLDLPRSLAFYEKALDLRELRRSAPAHGGFVIVFLGNDQSPSRLELTWLSDRDTPYELGDNETHLAFSVDDYEAAHALHAEMGCICYENESMGLYFIEDPDGYWLEILPRRG